jgi:hypothetical protein
VSEKSIGLNENQGYIFWQRIKLQVARIPNKWLSILILVSPFLLLIPSLTSFPFPASGSQFSDLAITHYPYAIYLKETISTWHEIPLWSQTILSGHPFAANPLSGLWYPFGWLILITPLPLGFNLLVGLHLIWGGLGMYSLMKEEGLSHATALLAGASFALLPKLFAHYGAGHLTLIYAVSWTPWLLWCQNRSERSKKRINSLQIPPGLILAIIFLADVRWGAFALFVWWAYAFVHNSAKWWQLFLNLTGQSILAVLLAAPLLLPLVEYSLLSTRATLGVDDVLTYSLPLVNLLGVIFPNAEGLHEYVLYSGGMVILLALVALLFSKLRGNKLFWGTVSLISIFIALGSQIPGAELVARLPLVSLLRVPSRALFITGLSFTALAGYGAETIIHSTKKDLSHNLSIFLFSVAVFSILLTIGIYLLSHKVPAGLLWGTGGLLLSTVWIGLGLKTNKLAVGVWMGGVFLITLLDLSIVDLKSFESKGADQVLAEREAVAQYLAAQPGDFRTYSPSYSLPQQTAAKHGIQLADGVDPLQLKQYVKFMDEASGVPRYSYSVTLPPYASGDPQNDNAAYSPDAEKLGLLSVAYVISEFELNVDGLRLEKQLDAAYIYKNTFQMPSAWVEENFEKGKPPVVIIERRPNRLLLSAVGPGKLTISENNYPGWQVKVDGLKRELLTQHGTLMAVNLEPGQHEIEFSFHPSIVSTGIFLFFLGLIGLAGNIYLLKRSSPRG